jgi:hypothetical protein
MNRSAADKPAPSAGTAVGAAEIETLAMSESISVNASASAATRDTVFQSAVLDHSLSSLSWLDDLDLLGNGSQKAKKAGSVAQAVDLVLGASVV